MSAFPSRPHLTLLGIIVTLGFASLAGCAEEREAIDRVQPYALEKKYFIGEDFQGTQDDPEFWTQGTLIDVGYGAAQSGLFVSTYAQPMSRIKWVVTEDYLFARLAYERIDDSDGKGAGKATTDGVIVGAWKIEKHFDITYAYNSTTGEKLNILEENTVDRPWYEREYMRVDWSKNQNVDSYDFDTLSMLGVYGGVTYEALDYDITDPTDADRPHFDMENGYFDITNKAFAKPGMIDLSYLGWGIDQFPACFLPADFSGGTAPAGNCNPVELTVRHSFRKVEDTDYEPVNWDGYRFQAYGGFFVERHGYDRNYGMTDDKWHRFLARYQIWERSHYYEQPETMTGAIECYTPDKTPSGSDPNRDEDGNGTADECEAAGAGSRCDTFKQKCTLPYQQRTAKPIVWYYTELSDPEYFDPTADATHEWDVAMRAAVRSAKYAECKATGGSDCEGQFPIWFGQQDENEDAVALAKEVDDCRNGLAYTDKNRDEAACTALADSIGEQRAYSSGVISVAKMPEMIVLCHSPVLHGDPIACGERRLPAGVTQADCDANAAAETPDEALAESCDNALRVRRGDLRYHQVNVIPEPATPSPWGIYTDAEDPLTGETVSASINVWSWVNEVWSQGLIDKARYIKGELTTEEITEGRNVRDWVTAARNSSSGGVAPKLTREEKNRRMGEFTRAHRTDPGAHAGHDHAEFDPQAAFDKLDPAIVEKARQLKREVEGVRAGLRATSAMRPKYESRRARAMNTDLEAELMTPMVQQLTGTLGMPMNESVLNQSSLLRGANPTFERDIYNLKQLALAERGACVMHEAPVPYALADMADVLEQKFGEFNREEPLDVQLDRSEKMRRYVARRAHFSVIAHEMGHSVGLRHNFVSSSDAFGYRPQYWQLRTKNGKVTEACDSITNDGASCVGPRYYDPVTQEENSQLIWMFMHSTVMDYAGELTQDMLGLGAYDFAATRMFYGESVAVFADETYKVGSARAQGMISKIDNFGGILGIQPRIGDNDIHYSQLQNAYDLIKDCYKVKPEFWKPAAWNDEIDGKWHPVLDGRIVSVDGEYTRCKTQKVDYQPWTSLRNPSGAESGGFYRGGQSIDSEGRIRVPYGFGTDGWADLGNLSVYRHDNGADPYELFDFFVTQQEMNHIFDNYRRGKETFSVRKQAGRTLHRFNEKMRDAAKGLGLLKNIYVDFALELGYDFDSFWPSLAPTFFSEQILASGLAFDHFARTMARPEAGGHYLPAGDTVLRSLEDVVGQGGENVMTVPNGATGYFGDISIGGKPLENRLADDKGEFDSQYTINVGSYYDKLYSAMLMTESVDNFISSSRTDFLDARYRAVSLADLFPDGYRRWLANNLTGDDELKGPRVAAAASGLPMVEVTDGQNYPDRPMGWISYWGDTPRVCFPANGTTVCDSYGSMSSANNPLNPQTPASTAVVDPQVGWEQQKFLIAWTMMYLPENQQQWWIDLMRIWELGKDADPGFEDRIEFHNPSGKVYVAKRYGTEEIFGQTVERGIAARVLEHANELLEQAYETTPGPDKDGDGEPDWYIPVIDPATGKANVQYDPSIVAITPDGFISPQGKDGCNATDNSQCTCSANRACMKLQRYVQVPFFLRQTMNDYGLADPDPKGIY